jgi:hypothetical protein
MGVCYEKMLNKNWHSQIATLSSHLAKELTIITRSQTRLNPLKASILLC